MTTDTHKAFGELLASGFTKQQAEAVLSIVARQDEDLVTKQDLKLALSELKGELNTKISDVKSSVIIWQIGIGFALYGALKFIH